VSANLVVKTGSGANPIDKPGLASFTAAMLDEGTASRTALQIADEVARLGASLGTSSTMDAMQVSAVSLRRNFDALVALMADVVRNPSFPTEEVERQRKSRLANLIQQRENPSQVAANTTAAVLYGASHPYGYPELGTESSNTAMNRNDLAAFWKQNFVPNNAAMIVSGQVTSAELRPALEKAFGEWQRGTPAQPALGSPATVRARLILVDRPGAPQTQLRVASIGASRATPDYEAILVMNEALGGLFSSRINLNLREQHGYTYGASSTFLFRRAPGPFLISTGVRTDVTAPAVAEIFKEVRRMRETELTAEELTLAKDSLVRGLPSQFETSSSVTASTASIYIYDLGLDYFTKLPARLSAVDAAQVKAAAEKYVVLDKLLVIAVGDRGRIAPELQKMNLGAVEVRGANGMPTAGSHHR
jgi:zinc protease